MILNLSLTSSCPFFKENMNMITPKVKLDLIEDFISECLCEYIDAQESLSKERIEESGEKLLVAQEVLEDVRKLYGVEI